MKSKEEYLEFKQKLKTQNKKDVDKYLMIIKVLS